jgi:predicted DNA-binding transcriptional regulator YafY
VDDGPVGRVADVERLLQLLALLRNSDGGWVALATLRSGVTAYRNSTSEDALERMIQRDLEALRNLGFAIEGETQEGTPARYRLKATAWRVPLDLDGHEQRLLAWVMAVAGASRDAFATTSSLPPAPTSEPLGSLLGSMPAALDVIHTALASRKQVVIRHNGADKTIEPAQMSVQQGRWFVIARYAGAPQFYGFRLDRLVVIRLGDPITEEITPPDPLTVIDNTAWPTHEPFAAELRCSQEDAERVCDWFPRADVSHDGDEVVMRFDVSNAEGLIDRVLSFGGAVWVVAPPEVRARIREQAASFVGLAS